MTYAGNINGFLFVAQVGCAFLQFVYLKSTEINFCAYLTRQQPPYIREISGKSVYSAVFA